MGKIFNTFTVHEGHSIFDTLDNFVLYTLAHITVRDEVLVSAATIKIPTTVIIAGLDNRGDEFLDGNLGNIARQVRHATSLQDKRMAGVALYLPPTGEV